MAGPWEAYQTGETPSVKERAAEADIGRAQASAASARALAQERTALIPARQQKAAADVRTAEAQAAQAEMALEKARNLISSVPPPEEVPAAREILLREIRNLAQARELSETMFSASGIGFDTLSGIGGSPAEQVIGLLNPILANEAFEALSKMRAESPTGGALGNVTERELDLLKSTGGYVPPTAGDKQFQQGIDDLIKHRIATLSKLGVPPQELAEALGPRYVEKFAPEVKSYRFSKRDEEALENYVKRNVPEGTFDPTDFAALMGQAYYNATGNPPDDEYIQSAFESAIQISDEGRESLGGFYYEGADEDVQKSFIGSLGSLAPDEVSLGDALGGAAINFIPATFELAADTVQALTLDLPDTIEGVVDIIGGATGISKDSTAWDALKDYYIDRYGSYAGFKRALREDPASIAADVAGLFTGGATILAKTAGTAGRVGKIAALSDAARKAEGFSRAVAKLDPLVTATDIAQTGARTAGRAAENIGVALPAKLLGVQTADVKQAVSAGRRGSEEFLPQLEGTGAITDPIAKAQSAVTELYQSRGQDYNRRMKRLKREPEALAFDDVEAAIEGVRGVGRHKGIDLSSAADVWEKVDGKYMEFFDKGLNTIEDFDAMKRGIANIRDTYQRGTPQYKVANDVVKAINDTIVEKAPIYADIMKDYRTASDTLADVQSSLSLGAKSADVTLNKLRRTAGGRTPRGTTVLDILESTQSGKGLGDVLSAQNLSGTEPSGIGASMGAVGSVGMGDPTLMAASAASPRAFGKAAFRAGEVMGGVDRARQLLAETPGAQRMAELASKYADPAATGVRVANPALIQPQIDPFEGIPEEQKQALIDAYSASAPTFGPAQTGRIRLEDLASTYTAQEPAKPKAEPINLGGFEPQYEEAAPAEGPKPRAGDTIIVDNREAVYDPSAKAYFFVDTGEIARKAMKRGGAVKGYKNGGLMDILPDAEDVKGFGRAVGEGALFGYNDELEALLRAAFAKDPEAYQGLVNDIRREQIQYAQDHPGWALAGNVVGGVGTAFVPGTQGLSAARVASMGPKARAAYELALGTAQGGLYGTGKMDDYPDSDRDPLAVLVSETAAGTLGYPAARGAAAVGRRVVPQGVKDFAARKGRELVGSRRVRRRAGR